jgi:hypothetical protein
MAVFVAGIVQMISTGARDSFVFEVVRGQERCNRSEPQKKEDAVIGMKVSVVAGVSYTTEDIPLDIIFQNDSEEPVRILDVFDNPAAKRVFFNIVLKDAEGSSIDIGGGWGRIDMSPGYAKYTELNENETMKVRINLKDYQLPSERLKPGVYSISVTYRNQYGTNCFKGTLESELHDLVLVK